MPSHALKRELGLRDLALTQIMYVVGTVWVGTAAKLGNQHIVFWLAAMVFFYLPQAAVVFYLSRLMPLEGGLYQWAKLGLNEHMGFMVAWNLWMYAVVLIAAMGLIVTTNVAYAFGADVTAVAGNRAVITAGNVFLIGALMLFAVLGLGVSKWVHNAGSVFLMVAFAVLIGLPFVQSARGVIPAYHPFAAAMPAFTLLSLNIFGKMGMGALSGFEYVAVLAGECKDPERTIGRATLIAAPVIALMFILGTSAVLAFVPPEKVDLVGPIPQVLREGIGAGSGLVAVAVPVVILLLTTRVFANSSLVFTGNTRMPMVAGWDHLLPEWFARLHARYRTPVNSIMFVGAVSLAFSLAGILGVGRQEAFQLLDNAAGILYGLTYLVMFAIPLVGLRGVTPKPRRWLRVAAGSGFAVTGLYVVLSIFPIIGVASWLSFALKISGVIVLLNVIGIAVYVTGRRHRAVTASVEAA